MHLIHIDPNRLVFPDRCLRCRAASSSAYMLRFGTKAVEVPLCASCGKARFRAQLGWIVGGVVAAAVAVVVAALVLDVIVPFAEDADRRRIQATIVGLALLVVAAGGTWFGVREALRRHRLGWDPVWVADASAAMLVFRNPDDARDVAALSYDLPIETGFREAPVELTPYVAKGHPLAWLVPAVLALGGIAVTIDLYLALGSGKRVWMRNFEVSLYNMGGRAALIGFWSIATVTMIALAIWMRRSRNDRTGEHL